ncbi:hypothetical protein I302_105889 [Kwoniella bestiolae CBS 10118]|uniref:C2H2-type domain-containing protein n=1 Tax=Kwoniella bestiolae CBS 10118 TaxID=1296100 RepID=A0A1B9G2G4_9TREE|nr:hypothetical protein I302_05014 [Kwoniella bestiolae CBS 10118]OCF25201.1 hypothetical protein I302_05014 [Kwoniella bestiolae CBS 10118]
MSDQAEPSFDAIFSSQQPPRRSSTSSSFNAYAFHNPYPHVDQHQMNPPPLGLGQGNGGNQFVDEPQQLHRKSSNASISSRPSNGRDRAGSSTSVSDMMMKGFNLDGHGNGRRQSSLRKESMPFNPEADSTIIATAPRQGNNISPNHGQNLTSPPIGDIMFGGTGQRLENQQHQQQYQHNQQQQPWTGDNLIPGGGILQQQQQQPPLPYPYMQNAQQSQHSPFTSPMPTPSSVGLDYMTPGSANSLNDSTIYDQLSPYTNPALTPNNQNNMGWGQDFVSQPESSQGGYSGYGGINTGSEMQGNGMDDMMGLNEQDALNNELQRIISNTSHHSSAQPSREPSPFPHTAHTPDPSFNQAYHNPPHTMSTGHSRQGSYPTSRSPSPFAPPHPQQQQFDMQDLTSPPLTSQFPVTASSSQGNSPFLNKPQSPPALIIPNQHSPSPVLPPIVTTAVAGPSGDPPRGAPRQGDLGGSVSGGLLPPANPALEHLTGMAGISPIAPSADGPMIYIQPSTPISGLRDGRGLFDAALRRAGQMAQHNQHGQQGQDQDQQQQGFNVPPPQSYPLARPGSSDQMGQPDQSGNVNNNAMDFASAMAFQASQGWGQDNLGGLGAGIQTRPRAKSDSFMPSPTADSFDRQALFNFLIGTTPNNAGGVAQDQQQQQQGVSDQWRNTVNAWRTGINDNDQNSASNSNSTLDPRLLPGQENNNNTQEAFQRFLLQQQHHQNQQNQAIDTSQQHQLNQLHAQRNRLPPLNTTIEGQGQGNGVFKYEPGEFSPTSMAFYQSIGLYPHSASELPGTTSAPFYTTTFGNISNEGNLPNTVGPSQASFLPAPSNSQQQGRRRSFGGGEGSNHPAAGAGTPGYGVEFTPQNNNSPFGQLHPGAVRGVSGGGHRRAAKSEDFGRVGTGWGVGAGGSTADFLQSITANDGSLLPPMNRGRSMSHSRNSSTSSIRSASPALSISSQGSNWSNMERMELPDGVQLPATTPAAGKTGGGKKRVAKMKVTSVATEVASTSRRTNSGVFRCPVPGCGSTFTRHFNLKGHLRSHNDERPYKCLYDGCPKSIVGFARQHDCKRHMLLHEGLRPFECEGCGKKFARLDALTRHHKSEQGQECAITHPLPVNPDGTPMSESQYKIYKGVKAPQPKTVSPGDAPKGGGGRRRSSGVKSEFLSGDDRSGGESDLGGGLSGMEEYDRF